MPDIRFDFLADRPEAVPICGRWEHEQWGRAGGRTLEQALACYAGSRRDGLPLTLIAVDGDGSVVGMVSLWECDCPLRPDLAPWVASLYVPPPARGRGIGNNLFVRIQAEARRLGFARLHLMTQHSAAHYAAAGWRVFDRVDGPGAMRDAVLMLRDLEGGPT